MGITGSKDMSGCYLEERRLPSVCLKDARMQVGIREVSSIKDFSIVGIENKKQDRC